MIVSTVTFLMHTFAAVKKHAIMFSFLLWLETLIYVIMVI